MSLRVRLIVAFFLMSVLPLGAVTLYTYLSNAAAMRDAAGREAELLAGDLTDRMTLVTTRLSQRFEQLMEIPTTGELQPTAVSAGTGHSPSPAPETVASQTGNATPATRATQAGQAAQAAPAQTAPADDAARLAGQLGEVAILLDSIEVRDFSRGRRAPGGPGALFDRTLREQGREPSFGPDGQAIRGGRAAIPSAAPDTPQPPAGPPPPDAAAPPAPPPLPASGGAQNARQGPPPGGREGQGIRGFDPESVRRGLGGPPPEPPEEPADPGRIHIDLGAVRREMVQQTFPDRQRWDQLSPEERELLLTKVNERMLGIEQGIQMLQQKAREQANDARAAAAQSSETSDAAKDTARATPPPAASAAASAPRRATPPAPPASRGQTPAAPDGASLQRQTALSGNRMDVRVVQNGQVVGQVNADINLPNLLATVFTTTRREQGEVPFAVDAKGQLYTPSDADRAVISSLNTQAARAGTPPGTTLLSDWVVVTTADPTGTGLKFGIARPLGDALDELRRSSARNAALGLGLIGLALIGIVPLSSRLTRNLSRLSDGVEQLARGDYHVRVDVSSKDEIGRLAGAFNNMAADVERHQRAAVEQERLRHELALGRQIQHDMLPQAPLRLGLTEVRGVSVPATEVGGDFFNYFETPSGRIALIVGDVSGKGVGAALLMANIQASLRTRFALGQDLAALARELDADIGASTPGSVYCTLFVGLLDPASRTLDYVNAGHNPQFVLRTGGALERMDSTGLPIGLLPGHPYAERQVTLSAGDVLFFYTDGCVEAENAAGDMFGSARLERVLIEGSLASADDILARVEERIQGFRSGREPFDDATMMVVKMG